MTQPFRRGARTRAASASSVHAPSDSRQAQLRVVNAALRKVGAQAVLISDLVAARVGLNASDLECLDLLYLAGATTAGRLAAHTGLTSGATTAVIDRLERAGFVHRRRDRSDRRLVLVEVVKSTAKQISPYYDLLRELLARVNDRYADHDLATIADYLSRALEAGAEHVAWLEQQPCPSRRRRRHRVAPAAESWLETAADDESSRSGPPSVTRTRSPRPTRVRRVAGRVPKD